jgi:predicted P-loop ATPase
MGGNMEEDPMAGEDIEEEDAFENVVPIQNARVEAKHWTLGLAHHRKAKSWEVIATEANVVVALKGSTTFAGLFRYNARTVTTEIMRRPPWDREKILSYPRPVEDFDIAQLRSMLCVQRDQTTPRSTGLGIMIENTAVFRGLESMTRTEMSYDPVVVYLETLKWDGVPRLDTCLERHFLAVSNDISRTMWRRWMVSAVKRAYQPGCQADHMLILRGEQGIGKSRLLRELFGLEWHVDGFPDVHSAYAPMALEGQWCVESGELAKFSSSYSQEALKQFLTTTVDKYKKPFNKTLTVNYRKCVFVGTTNKESFLNDDSGERRYWPIHLMRKEKLTDEEWKAFTDEKDQLWAEALHLYKSGEPIHLKDKVHLEALAVVHEEVKLDDALVDRISKLVDRASAMTPGSIKEIGTDQILELLGIEPHNFRKLGLDVHKSMCLLGWKKITANRNGQRFKVWRKVYTPTMPTKEESEI